MSLLIEALIRVAQREDVDLALHFGTKPDHWALHLDRGEMVHQEKSPVVVPWPVARTGEKKPNLLFDSRKYMLTEGIHRDKSKDLHARWAAMCPKHPAVDAVQAFFAKAPPSFEIPTKYATSDVVLYFEGKPVGVIPELWGAIDRVLREQYKYIEHESRYDEEPLCVLDTHGKLSFFGLSNSQALIGYNQDVSRSGLTHEHRMLHASMSYEAMRLHIAGLEWLRQKRTLSVPTITGGGAMHCLAWTEQPHRIETLVETLLRGPRDITHEEWRTLVDERLETDHELFVDDTPYNVLFLACSSRIAVRGFHTMTVGQLAHRIAQYRNDFASAAGRRMVTSPWAILQQLRPGSNPSLSVVERFYSAIFLGTPYPRELLRAALNGYTQDHLAYATINAFAQQLHRNENPMLAVHSDTLSQPFFLAGRLFAVLEARNYAAKDPADRTTVTHHLKQAWSNPAKKFPWLLALSEAHAQKLWKRKHYTFTDKVNDLFIQMMDALSKRENPAWPGQSTPEEKMLFAQGREYQRRTERNEMEERIEKARQKKAGAEAEEEQQPL